MNYPRVRIRTIAIALALLAPALTSHSNVLAKDNWTSVRSQNFQLVGNASEKDIRLVANRLEQFRTVFALLFPALKLNSPVPTTVIVFKSDSSYKPYKVNPNVTGYFQPGKNENTLPPPTKSLSATNPTQTSFINTFPFLSKIPLAAPVPF